MLALLSLAAAASFLDDGCFRRGCSLPLSLRTTDVVVFSLILLLCVVVHCTENTVHELKSVDLINLKELDTGNAMYSDEFVFLMDVTVISCLETCHMNFCIKIE
jgi:hypothetical protein